MIRSMGAFGHEFAARDRQATVNFGEAARVAGTERIVYLGGLEAVGRALGGADVLTYREMMRRTAIALGRRPPLIVPVPVLSPRLSSYWVSAFTPFEAGLVRPLIDGLSSEMVVREAPPAGLNDDPLGFGEAVRSALP